MLHNICSCPFRPNRELFGSSSSKCICRRQKNFLPFFTELGRKFPDGRRLTHPIDSHYKVYFRMMGNIFLSIFCQHIHHRFFHKRHHFIRTADHTFRHTAPNLPHQIIGGAHAKITGEKNHLQIFQKVIINFCITDNNRFDIFDQTFFGLF